VGRLLAEREGFEPSVELYALHSLSRRAPSAYSAISPDIFRFMAEGVGFEPTELSLNGFQDRRHRPLGHPSPSAMVFKFNINYKIYQYIKQKNSLLFTGFLLSSKMLSWVSRTDLKMCNNYPEHAMGFFSELKMLRE
jgi:hypothetical protein